MGNLDKVKQVANGSYLVRKLLLYPGTAGRNKFGFEQEKRMLGIKNIKN